MKSPKAPEAPDPKQTAAAQTQSNIGTAVANSLLQGNQVTPYGSMSHAITGYNSWTDPSTGQTYELPQTTTTTSLSPAQQGLLNSQTKAKQSVANTATAQAGKLGSILGRSPHAPDLAEIGALPVMGKVGAAPKMATTFGSAGNVTNKIANAGGITRTYGTDFSADRQKVEDALMARMNPSLSQERDRLTSQLSNQGIKLGTEAFDRAMAQRGQQENDARMAAILAGGQEQSRMTGLEAGRAAFQNQAQAQQFGQNATRSQFSNDAQQQLYDQLLGRATFGNVGRQQMFANDMSRQGFNNDASQQMFNNQLSRINQRNDARVNEFGMGQQARSGAINNVNALMSGGQVSMPQFAAGGGQQMPGIDMAALINNQYQGQLGNYNAQVQNRNQMMGGLFGLGASGIMALSDERTKTEIEPLGVEVEGNPVYAYEYKHDPGTRHVGVMAQDVAKTRPDAVVPMGKFLGVNYSKLVA